MKEGFVSKRKCKLSRRQRGIRRYYDKFSFSQNMARSVSKQMEELSYDDAKWILDDLTFSIRKTEEYREYVLKIIGTRSREETFLSEDEWNNLNKKENWL